jgi:hypothetical protein
MEIVVAVVNHHGTSGIGDCLVETYGQTCINRAFVFDSNADPVARNDTGRASRDRRSCGVAEDTGCRC